MTEPGDDMTVGTLPDVLPLFPLNGILLLPRGHLPLNIFEPRYVQMTETALKRDRMIGIVQPLEQQGDPIPHDAEIYTTGCVGRIAGHRRTNDGRFLITLKGISRYRQVEELTSEDGYRRIRVSYEDFPDDQTDAPGPITGRDRLLEAIGTFFDLKGATPDWTAVVEAPDEELVTSLSMICPFDAPEKQALLECTNLTERSGLLTALMEMAIHGSVIDAPQARH